MARQSGNSLTTSSPQSANPNPASSSSSSSTQPFHPTLSSIPAPIPILSTSTLSPASLTPAQPTLSLAHARRSTNNPFNNNAAAATPIPLTSTTTISRTTTLPQIPDLSSFQPHPDFTINAENRGDVLVVVTGIEFYVHKDLLFFASPFFKTILQGGWSESKIQDHRISISSPASFKESEENEDSEGDPEEGGSESNYSEELNPFEGTQILSNPSSSTTPVVSKSRSELSSDSDERIDERNLIVDEEEDHDLEDERPRSRVRASFHTAHFSLDASDPSADEKFHQLMERRKSPEEIDDDDLISSSSPTKRKGPSQQAERKREATETALRALVGDLNQESLDDNVISGDFKGKSRRRSASESEVSLRKEFKKELGISRPNTAGNTFEGDHKEFEEGDDVLEVVDLEALATPPLSPVFNPEVPIQKLTSKEKISPLSQMESSTKKKKKAKKLVEMGKQRWDSGRRKVGKGNKDEEGPSSNTTSFRDTLWNQTGNSRLKSSRSVSEPVSLKSRAKGKDKGKGKERDLGVQRAGDVAGASRSQLIINTPNNTSPDPDSLVAVVELHEEEASTFQDFLFHIYPHLDGVVTWKSVSGLMRFNDKFEVPFLRQSCLHFLRQSLAGRPIHAMSISEEFGLDLIYREASRHVLDNYSNWTSEELDELSAESLIKIERKRSWFLERVLKLSTSNPGRDYECQPNCPDPVQCSKTLHERFRSSYVNAFRFGPPRPSEIWRLLREFDGIGSGSGLYACLAHSKAWVQLLFDRMFEINQTGGIGNRLFLSIKLELNGGKGKS